ncbi:hypothetical protein B0F90DRAFT_1678793 [Multifurca ochricompacta]|uniref:Uncharacterized protein n=1 Tax=Multifurca ochricompacta TaxID=376703 RepID=A0AAD4QU35_9AGAM|nr:hypothetical protein B0F90DRAFT_1678793 [Multifurca ochricompacta]
MSSISPSPHGLSRHSSIWSILRSLETLSPPPSWSSLDNLVTASGFDNLVNDVYVGTEKDSSPRRLSTNDSLDLVSNGRALSESEGNNAGNASLAEGLSFNSFKLLEVHMTSPGRSPAADRSVIYSINCATSPVAKRSCFPRTTGSCGYDDLPLPKPPSPTLHEGTHPIRGLPQALAVQHTKPLLSSFEGVPQAPSDSPGLSSNSPFLERPQSTFHKDSVHAVFKHSGASCSELSGTISPHPAPSRPDLGDLSLTPGPSGRRRDDHMPTISSNPSSPLNQPLTHSTNYTSAEIPDADVPRFPCLPMSLSWLESTILEVMIDQEGFRVIRPIFRLAGYSSPATKESDALSLSVELVSATADFMPTQRKSFVFHHSALETPPVLRRLMVNGDASCDYLSRQAYLVVEANGPYTIQGNEPLKSSSRLFPTAGPVALAWKLDYLVGDRRTETGRVLPGEKTFTPLSFSCSPALLQPTQARKIRVVHVVRKSVATKLTAVKMGPPTPPRPHLGPESVPLHTTRADSREIVIKKHRRARSHVSRNAFTLRHSTQDPAQLSSSQSFSDSPPSSRVRGEASRPIVSMEAINALFPMDVSSSLS